MANGQRGRGNTELVEVFRGESLVAGGSTRFSRQFPLGEGWTRLILVTNTAVTIGTGAGPIAEGETNILRGATFRTDRGEYPYNNIPGRPLFRFGQLKSGTLGVRDAIAAVSATYRVYYDLWFVDPLMNIPIDTVLDTARYSAVELVVNMGTVADLFTAPGTATIALTADCYAERIRGPIPVKVRPKLYHEVGVRGPQDPAVLTYIDMERAANLAYKRWLTYAMNSVTAGVPFSGTPSDSTIADWTVDHDGGRAYDTILHRLINARNKAEYMMEAAVPGMVVFDFAKDGSIQSSLYSGNKSRLRLQWNNGTLSTSAVSMAYEALRPLK